MTEAVALDDDLLDEVVAETGEKDKDAAVRKALEEFLRERRIRELRGMADTTEMLSTNEEIEAMGGEAACDLRPGAGEYANP